jgi:hypothetical protein
MMPKELEESTAYSLGSVTMRGPTHVLSEVRRQTLEYANRALFLHGPSAFDSPRSAATTHEAGHVVVYAHFGISVLRSKVWKVKRGPEHGQWIGFTSAGSKWRSDGASDAGEDFQQACCAVAGVLAEQMFDRDNFREASSIDEIVAAQGLVSNISHKLGCDYQEMMTKIIVSTIDILSRNADLVKRIERELSRSGVLRQRRLTELLAAIDFKPTALDLR